jgi:hypothetical protein
VRDSESKIVSGALENRRLMWITFWMPYKIAAAFEEEGFEAAGGVPRASGSWWLAASGSKRWPFQRHVKINICVGVTETFTDDLRWTAGFSYRP